MTLPARDHAYLTPATIDQVAAMVLELASQLHVERQRRMALEAVLRRQGVLADGAVDAMVEDETLLADARGALDANLRRLLRIMTETGDPRGPLRAEAL
ncbi:MAG: hypothetical protein J0H67_04830 [Rhodospirillales bacterium]|nr:hypothetical protein [Rhodospirillales bacterium]